MKHLSHLECDDGVVGGFWQWLNNSAGDLLNKAK
jgi:hypothetical protein